MEGRRRVEWVIETAALAACAALVIEATVTIHGAPFTTAATATVVLVLCADVAAGIGRAAPMRLAPWCFIVLLPGLVGSGSPRVSVWAFAFAALLPLAVIYASDTRVPSFVLPAVLVTATATVLARILYRDPFREVRCAPACVFNPDLRVYAPHIVRGAEWALALAVALWGACALARLVERRSHDRARCGAPPVLIALAVLTVLWASRLAQQPRPLPDDAYDRCLFAASLAAIAVAAGTNGRSAAGVAVARRRITRDARSLSHAATLESITGHLQRATGDPELRVRLGADDAPGTATTSVVRGGRVVASIDHRPSARQRVAVAVTPAIALALETQLLLAEARAHVAELERSRARVVETTDSARRRLERDLHDGAQQRLLVVGMRLAHAADERPASDTWRTAVTHVADALAELRRIGRGDAAIIAELGLQDAVTALVGTSPVAIRVGMIPCAWHDHDCWPQTTATAIYRLVVGSLADAEWTNAEELAVELRCMGEGHGHTVLTRHRGTGHRDRAADHDRVVACGGRIVTDRCGEFEAWLP